MEVAVHAFEATADMPNSALPLVVMSQAVPADEADSRALASRFRENGWQGTWTYTVFDYWHYHETGHEVLACCAGGARIGFGGDGGVEIDMRPGDVVVVPAGVGHRRLSGTADFSVVGAYPPGQNGAVTRAGNADIEAGRRRAERLALPDTDPVSGERPGDLRFWHDGRSEGKTGTHSR